MADSKVDGLVKRVFSSLANITGVRIWSQKSGEADALGLEMSEMISSAIVAEASTLDYKGLTPKGFSLSVATTSRKGIVELATDAEIASETANKTLQADDQEKMRENWAKASDTANALGKAKVWQEDGIGEGETEPFAYKFTITFHTNKPDSTQKAYYPLPFVMPAGKRIYYAVVNGVYSSPIGASNINTNNEFLDISSSDKEIQFGSNSFKIAFPSDGSPMYILLSFAGRSSCVLDVHAIIR